MDHGVSTGGTCMLSVGSRQRNEVSWQLCILLYCTSTSPRNTWHQSFGVGACNIGCCSVSWLIFHRLHTHRKKVSSGRNDPYQFLSSNEVCFKIRWTLLQCSNTGWWGGWTIWHVPGIREIPTGFWWRNVTERGHFGSPRLDTLLISKCILKETGREHLIWM